MTSSTHPALSPEALAHALGRPLPTDAQAAVIAGPLQPTLVVAGAGSGKTETIAQRVVYLVANGKARPNQILGLTFTRKAAGELAHRIRSRLNTIAGVLGDDVPGVAEVRRSIVDAPPAVSTYHAFAGEIISEFGPLIGEGASSRVLSATDSWQLARSVVARWDRDLDTDLSAERVTSHVLALSSVLAEHLVDAEALDDELGRILETLQSAPPSVRQSAPVHSGLVSAVKQLTDRRAVIPLLSAFREAKRAIGAVDFSDQMRLAARIVQRAPQVGETLRSRFPIVLLDEYQDTGHSQRVILRGIFGEAATSQASGATPWRGHAVTAVGDPVQSIYAWRGASASNLPRFTTDFPLADGRAAPTRQLLTSFRNARRILDIANAISAPVRNAPVKVDTLHATVDADAGDVTMALLPTVVDEDEWLAEEIASIWRAGPEPPTLAVLARQRASMGPIAAALRRRNVPVEVVGVGGLIDEPEVADIIAMLRMVVDHRSGPSAVRILTGARWRLGIADLAALARRARELNPARTAMVGHGATEQLRIAMGEAASGEDVDDASLVDALADPGNEHAYSPAGWQRIRRIGDELRRLRSSSTGSLRDLIAATQRTLGIDVEARLRPGGLQHLDTFAAVVAELEDAGAGPVELLDYLAAAAEREDGLALDQVAAPSGKVQVLTVHAAKGLEWDVVAVPHLVDKAFPSDMNTTWLGDPTQIPPSLRGDGADVPQIDLPRGQDQSELARALSDHRAAWATEHLIEERRLFYVAVTRARRHLLLSAHHWTATRKRPAGPSAFFLDFAAKPTRSDGAPQPWRSVPIRLAPSPTADESNPLLDQPATGSWPIDPLGPRRTDVADGADLVRQAIVVADQQGKDHQRSTEGDADGWWADAELLLAERAAARRHAERIDVPLPPAVSVSALVQIADDADGFARRLRRPVPLPPSPQARRGTAFHAWVEKHFAGEPLLDIGELPGAHDSEAADDSDVARLIAAFRHSPWATRSPVAVEVPFTTRIGGLTLRGRIDAVFTDSDGTTTVVDWKTGAVPSVDRRAALAVQLTAYRIAWARLSGTPLHRVHAAFYYVAHDQLVTPADLLDADGLARLIAHATAGVAAVHQT